MLLLRTSPKYRHNEWNTFCLKYVSSAQNCNFKNRRYYSSSTSTEFPQKADVVIVGGGIIGCSTFYHLSKLGVKPILLEKNKITCGTTWQSAGLVWSLRGNDIDISMLQQTRKLLKKLEAETGINPMWVNTGGLFIARNAERLEEYKRFHTIGHFFNIDNRLVSPFDAQELFEILDPSSFYGALYTPEDGYVNPRQYCEALVKGGLDNGGMIFEDTQVNKILTEDVTRGFRKISGVETTQGTILTKSILNSAGAWSRKIGKLAGVDVPITALKHSYIITESVPGIKQAVCIRDHDGAIYFRPHEGGILLGGYESNPEILHDVPDDFQFRLFDMDNRKFDSHWKQVCKICPSLKKIGIKSSVCGLETFTPDHKPILGDDPSVVGLFHATGFNSLGTQLSGGVGNEMANWIVNGRPQVDMHSYDIRRFAPIQKTDTAWVTETCHEAYITNYDIGYVNDQPLAGRNLRIDPFHELMVASGAVMQQSQGWERPAYFIEDRTAPVRGYDWYGSYGHIRNRDTRYEKEVEGDLTFDFSKHQNAIRHEALACRNNVALFNQSCYTKMYLTGPDSQEAANWIFTGNLSTVPDEAVHTYALNSKGGIEADLTVTTLREGTGTLVGPLLKGVGYYIVAGGACGYEAIVHIRKEIYKKNFKCVVTEITEKIGILSIQGPKSADLLQLITDSPITNEKFPYGMTKIIKVNNRPCRAMRISFVGELGYELHIPADYCVAVYNKIMQGGIGYELKHAGFRALDNLSCEKGIHLKNYDLRTDDNPIEAGIVRSCRKDGYYQGKEVVEKLKQSGVKKKRVFLTLNKNIALQGLETIWRDDVIVGYLRRGAYGFSIDSPIGIGYVHHPRGNVIDKEYLLNGDYQIEVRNKKYPATLYIKSPFDPENQRLLGIYEGQFEEQPHFED